MSARKITNRFAFYLLHTLYLIWFVSLFPSCGPSRTETEARQAKSGSFKLVSDSKELEDVEEYTYQGCEYICLPLNYGNGKVFSHKGNCKNKIHDENR